MIDQTFYYEIVTSYTKNLALNTGSDSSKIEFFIHFIMFKMFRNFRHNPLMTFRVILKTNTHTYIHLETTNYITLPELAAVK